MFSVTVESHCQGKQNQKIPWQCDQTLCGNIPEYCKLHSSDLGKNQCKQGIKFLKLNCHSGIALAYLKRRSIVDSHHRPMFEIVVSNSKRRWAESFSELLSTLPELAWRDPGPVWRPLFWLAKDKSMDQWARLISTCRQTSTKDKQKKRRKRCPCHLLIFASFLV